MSDNIKNLKEQMANKGIKITPDAFGGELDAMNPHSCQIEVCRGDCFSGCYEGCSIGTCMSCYGCPPLYIY